MKSLIGNSLLLGLAAATAMVVGCSAGSSAPTGSGTGSNTQQPSAGDVGNLGLRLSLPDGTTLSSVNYTLSNGTTTVQSGPLNVSNSQSIDFQLGAVPAGTGYTITLQAASADGGITCLGAAGPFAVVAHSTVNETVQVICQSLANTNGNIFINGVPDFCGTWNSVSTIGPGVDAAPTNGSEVLADGVTPIVITATASGASPTSLHYTWSAVTNSGAGVTLGTNVGNGTTTDTLTVTCNLDATDAVGSSTLTLVVTDSLDGGAVTCPTSLSTVTTTVFCDKIASCSPPTTNCGTGSTLNCVNETNDPANCGACGHVCSGATPSCSGSVCVPLICTGGTTACSGVCVNEQTDPNNCGSCGHSCGTGGTCAAGVCVVSAPQACSNFLAAHPALNPVSTTCSKTEVVTWQKDNTGVCLTCLMQSGCLDIAGLGGSECQDNPPLTGGPGSTNENLCLSVLACDIGQSPAAHPGPASGLTINAFCGQGVTSGVCNTAPAGACVSQWEAGFPGQTPSQIQGELGVQTFPGGQANSIATCANANCATQCF
jgi:Stigma-specific protein, Stig1